MRRFTHHLRHYLPLLGILGAGLLGFAVFSYDKAYQATITVAVAAGYVAWGIIHHHIHQDLHTSVIIEYFAIGLLGIVIVASVLFRA